MSNPFISLKLYEDEDAQTFTSSGLNENGFGMMSQIHSLPSSLQEFGITGVQTLIEPANYGFYVYLINKSDDFLSLLEEEEELYEKYNQIQIEGREFKLYMIDKLYSHLGKKIPKDNDIYMICVSMTDMNTLNTCNVVFLCSALVNALNKIHYGVEVGSRYNFRDRKGGKTNNRKKGYKKSYKRKTKKKQKTRKIRRYKNKNKY